MLSRPRADSAQLGMMAEFVFVSHTLPFIGKGRCVKEISFVQRWSACYAPVLLPQPGSLGLLEPGWEVRWIGAGRVLLPSLVCSIFCTDLVPYTWWEDTNMDSCLITNVTCVNRKKDFRRKTGHNWRVECFMYWLPLVHPHYLAAQVFGRPLNV